MIVKNSFVSNRHKLAIFIFLCYKRITESGDDMNKILTTDVIFFSDSLQKGKPFISNTPRNHDSLFFVTKGDLLYIKDDNQEIVPTGHVGHISKGSIDYSGPWKCDEVSYLAVNFNFGNDLPSPHLPLQTDCSLGTKYPYEKLFRTGLKYYSLKSPGYDTVCNGLAMQIIGHLLQETALPANNHRNAERIMPALEHIQDHFQNPDLEVSHLAALCELSEKQFRRIFTSVLGRTPYAFLQAFRISKAEVMLQNTGKSITEIGLFCGFSDVYSFSHCFKAHNQLSPAAFRERNKA